MPGNRGMVTLAKKLNFDVDVQMDDGIVSLKLLLQDNVSLPCREK